MLRLLLLNLSSQYTACVRANHTALIKQEQPVIFLTGHFAPDQNRTKRFSYAGLERHVINVLVIQPPNDSFGWFPGGMIVQHTSLNDFNLLRPQHFRSMHL